MRERRSFFEEVLADARAAGEEPGLDVMTTMHLGHPAEVIVRHALESGADLVVVGHKGHFLHDFLLGSTAARVTRHAPCPVLVVR